MKQYRHQILKYAPPALALWSLAVILARYGFGLQLPFDQLPYPLLGAFSAWRYYQKAEGAGAKGLQSRRSARRMMSLGAIVALLGAAAALTAFPKVMESLLSLLVLVLVLLVLGGSLLRLPQREVHPALAFVLSFLVLILIGTLLLLMPRATVGNISVTDALFTATSAVCVTGLTVLTTGEDFTLLGQGLILLLLQLGGLGMLTFTNVFALFFRGFSSFRNRLLLKDILNSRTMGGTRRMIYRILAFTFLAEGIGLLLLLVLLEPGYEPEQGRFFFALFHAVSAFCNAGFSTLPASLHDAALRHNYGWHLVVAVLIILGGIGFNTVIGYFSFIRQAARYYFYRIWRREERAVPAVLPVASANTKLVLRTTALLLLLGTLVFYWLEHDNSLQGHSGWGKWVGAFFGAVTPRTAGFSTVDTAGLALPTLLVTSLLMWIGASPGSTGGGIKTTTFGVVLLNIWQQVVGNAHIRLGWRRIPEAALHRALAIISLSLAGIGAPVFVLIGAEPDKELLPIAFECISAYCTVGLSMGITAELSEGSKWALTATMFVGRVSFLTLLSGMVRQTVRLRHDPAHYPEEDIFIN